MTLSFQQFQRILKESESDIDVIEEIANAEGMKYGFVADNVSYWEGDFIDAFMSECRNTSREGPDAWEYDVEPNLDRDYIVRHLLNGDDSPEAWERWSNEQKYSDWHDEQYLQSWLHEYKINEMMEGEGYKKLNIDGQDYVYWMQQ